MVNEDYKPMHGNFTYVGLDIDTTGRRLIDEIVQIAAYTPEKEFSQHIMPLMNLNPGARIRHQIRVINVGCFRMLKSTQTYKVIKTKTEIAALMEFIEWIEALDKKDGVIFVYHEQKKFIPLMIIEALRKYRLLERFEKSVKSFVNGFDLGEKDRNGGLKYLNFSDNRKVQMEKLGMVTKEEEVFEGDATVRAKLSYEIVKLMSYDGENKELDEEQLRNQLNEFVRVKAKAVNTELDDIAEQEECIKRQSSLREIFRIYFQTSRYHRRHAVTFRRILAEEKHDMETLQKKWDEGKRDAMIELVKKIETLKEDDQLELADILDAHFDPEKKPIRPIVQRRENNNGNNNQMRRRRRNTGGNRNSRGNNMNNKENNQDRPRSNSRRRRRSSTNDKRFGSNNNNTNAKNNNNMMDPKTGAIRKETQQAVDANGNILGTAY